MSCDVFCLGQLFPQRPKARKERIASHLGWRAPEPNVGASWFNQIQPLTNSDDLTRFGQNVAGQSFREGRHLRDADVIRPQDFRGWTLLYRNFSWRGFLRRNWLMLEPGPWDSTSVDRLLQSKLREF